MSDYDECRNCGHARLAHSITCALCPSSSGSHWLETSFELKLDTSNYKQGIRQRIEEIIPVKLHGRVYDEIAIDIVKIVEEILK